MAYEYDLFISYRSGEPSDDTSIWVRNIFYPLLERKLRSEMETPPRIFIDNHLSTGTLWESKIKRALARTKILIPIYVPSYFQREWCQKEFWYMQYREQKLRTDFLQNDQGIIWPIYLADGKHYPTYSSKYQAKDLRNWFFCSEYFLKTEKYFELEEKVHDLAKELSLFFDLVPEWQEEWETESWWNEVTKIIPERPEQHFSLPKL